MVLVGQSGPDNHSFKYKFVRCGIRQEASAMHAILLTWFDGVELNHKSVPLCARHL